MAAEFTQSRLPRMQVTRDAVHCSVPGVWIRTGSEPGSVLELEGLRIFERLKDGKTEESKDRVLVGTSNQAPSVAVINSCLSFRTVELERLKLRPQTDATSEFDWSDPSMEFE